MNFLKVKVGISAGIMVSVKALIPTLTLILKPNHHFSPLFGFFEEISWS